MEIPCRNCVTWAVCKNKFRIKCSLLCKFLEEISNREYQKIALDVHLFLNSRYIRWELKNNTITIFGPSKNDPIFLKSLNLCEVNFISQALTEDGECKYFILTRPRKKLKGD